MNVELFFKLQEGSFTRVFEVLHKATSGRSVSFGEQWEELNFHLGKVFVQNVYRVFYIYAFCHWLLNTYTGNGSQHCPPSPKWNLSVHFREASFSCVFVLYSSSFQYEDILCVE